MEFIRIKHERDIERLSEKKCFVCWQDFEIGDEIAILPCCKKPLDTVELWEHIAICIHEDKQSKCPHCRSNLQTRPILKIYPRDQYRYLPSEEPHPSFENLLGLQEEQFTFMYSNNMAIGSSYLSQFSPEMREKIVDNIDEMFQAKTGKYVTDPYMPPRELDHPMSTVSRRMELLKPHWQRQAQDIRMNNFSPSQFTNMAQVVWPIQNIEMDRAICLRASFHHIASDNGKISGLQAPFCLLAHRHNTIAFLGKTFLRTLFHDMFDDKFNFSRWCIDDMTPFFMVEENGEFRRLQWSVTVTSCGLNSESELLIQEFEITPLCTAPFWAKIVATLNKTMRWRRAAAQLEQEHERKEEEIHSLKLRAIWLMHSWNKEEEEKIVRLLQWQKGTSDDDETKLFAAASIQSAQTRIRDRRDMIDRIISQELTVVAEGQKLVFHPVRAAESQTDVVDGEVTTQAWDQDISQQDWQRFFRMI